MIGSFKRQWRAFRGGKPGHRFVDRYTRSQQSRKSQSWVQRLIQPFAAIILLAIGVVLTFIPGPAVVFYFAAAGLLAGESRTLARGLDWTELKSRKAYRWFKHWWHRASLVTKSAVIFVGVCAVGAMGFGAYQVFLAK
jgi:hypothetical protein